MLYLFDPGSEVMASSASSGFLKAVPTIVSTQWLSQQIAAKVSNLRVLDGTWHLRENVATDVRRSARDEYRATHIPGALLFDLERWSDSTEIVGEKTITLRHQLPSVVDFEHYVSNDLGIDENTHVVVYDNNERYGMLAAPRVWWTFRVFGHDKVSIMDGGLPKWLKEGCNVTNSEESVTPKHFSATVHAGWVKDFGDMEGNLLREEKFQVVDVRLAGAFHGREQQRRAGT